MRVWESENKIISPNQKKKYLEIVDQIATPFAAGELYYFIFSLHTYSFDYVSKSIKNVLGIKPQDFTLEHFFERLHPEDLGKMNEKETASLEFLLKHVPTEDIPLYKVVYLFRLRDADNQYKTILHQARAINISNGGKIQQTICVHTDVTHLNIPVNHKISFISTERPSYYAIETEEEFKLSQRSCHEILSKREQEVLKHLSKGMTVKEIAETMFLSYHTICTHRKNILKKSGCKNITELVAKCIREGVI